MKTGEKESDIILIDDEDFNAMSEFEKSIVEGRFLLEKKQKLALKNSSKILTADYCATESSKLLVLGFSNGQFSIFNIDTLEHINSF